MNNKKKLLSNEIRFFWGMEEQGEEDRRLNICIISWGSLTEEVSEKAPLCITRNWNMKGPFLPLEYSHKRDDTSLQLVIDVENGKLSPTEWYLLSVTSVEEALDEICKLWKIRHQNLGRWDPSNSSCELPESVEKRLLDFHEKNEK